MLKAVPLAEGSKMILDDDRKGTLIDLSFVPDDTTTFEEIRAHCMIFDGVGNLVTQQESGDNLEMLSGSGYATAAEYLNEEIRSSRGVNQLHLTFYWSGCTQAGIPAAPGMYRGSILLELNGKQHKLFAVIAVTR